VGVVPYLDADHVVAELATGVDLVKLQLFVAAGGRLSLDPPRPSGHALVARITAEDPDRSFEVPQTLNVRHGVFVVENLDTAALAADGVRGFALVLTHPKLRGATGAWTSPIALV
jgi:acetyl/propionyl-CoA carboxylase alpha subunit